MTLATRSPTHWMTQRRCVGCGLRAETDKVEPVQPDACPRCGIDWFERPPQSYAELEGFAIDAPALVEMPKRSRSRRSSRRTRILRTLEITLFMLLIVMVLVVASANIVAALRGGIG